MTRDGSSQEQRGGGYHLEFSSSVLYTDSVTKCCEQVVRYQMTHIEHVDGGEVNAGCLTREIRIFFS